MAEYGKSAEKYVPQKAFYQALINRAPATIEERHDKAITIVLRKLGIREREVLTLKYGIGSGTPLSQEEVAKALKTTESDIIRIEALAIKRFNETNGRKALEDSLD